MPAIGVLFVFGGTDTIMKSILSSARMSRLRLSPQILLQPNMSNHCACFVKKLTVGTALSSRLTPGHACWMTAFKSFPGRFSSQIYGKAFFSFALLRISRIPILNLTWIRYLSAFRKLVSRFFSQTGQVRHYDSRSGIQCLMEIVQ